MSRLKQILIIRTDLKMRRGKEISQGAHASMKATIENLDHPMVQEWLAGSFTKIVVCIDSEEALLALYDEAQKIGVISALIQDAGRTEFAGVKTYTSVAIGPGDPDKIAALTGHLKLR
jgi:PTH2 family peptidyl-tRNA hydrolase